MLYDQSEDQLIIMGASADATTSTGKLLLATSLTDVNANDVIGKIEFQAPHETGTDAITVAAAIEAVAQGTFAAAVNATDIIFKTGHSEAATEKFRFTSEGELGIGGATYGSSGDVLTSGGAGAAPTWATPTTGDITGVTAGDGLSGGGTSSTVALALDLNELTAAVVADGDFIPIIDTNDSNGSRKEAVHDLATLFAGTGLTATNSVIAVDASQGQITTVGALDAGSITSGFTSIDVGSGGITTTGAIAGGTIDASTDFTIGDTVITDGVVTDSTGLQLAANLDIDGTADISGDLTLSGGADGALQFTNAGENSIKIPDNQASALIIEEADNAYITFVTTNSSEAITVAKATTFSAAVDLGSNTLTSTGSMQIRTIDYSDGDLAITIADGGGVTFAQIDDAHLDSSPTDETVSGITATFTAGEDLVRGEVVYFKAGDSKMWKAVASAAGTMPVAAMAAADISADATGKFLLYGFLADNGTFPAYTVGGDLYAPEAETSSENVPEQTAPDSDGDFVQVLGYAVTANSVFFDPDQTIVEVA